MQEKVVSVNMVRWFWWCSWLLFLLDGVSSGIRSDSAVKAFVSGYHSPHPQLSINKVSLTQKGYIQFLRYVVDVPPISDYTFCIWMNSNNLTYAHPLLSYSKHEKEKLIRVWLSPFGKHINLEIIGRHVFKIPSNFRENKWYYICQSWSTHEGAWNLFLNGKLKFRGVDRKLHGVVIKGGGDIVVGQEYTDFDKGLDDGIEGDIFGFNFILDSTPKSLTTHSKLVQRRNFRGPLTRPCPHHELQPQQANVIPLGVGINAGRKTHIGLDNQHIQFPNENIEPHLVTLLPPTPSLATEQPPHTLITLLPPHFNYRPTEVPPVLSYFNVRSIRQPKGLLNYLGNMFYGFARPEQKTQLRLKTIEEFNAEQHEKLLQIQNQNPLGQLYSGNVVVPTAIPLHQHVNTNRVMNDIQGFNHDDSAGLALVELGYNCALGKGAPLKGKKVLISWTQTTVRVFGGATLKNIPPFCLINAQYL